MCASHAMPDANDRAWHFLALYIHEMEEVARMVEPAG
jgi:hypothetical protein